MSNDNVIAGQGMISRELALLLLSLAGLAAVFGIMMVPQLAWPLFGVLCMLFLVGVFVYRSNLPVKQSRNRPRYVDAAGRDAQVCQAMAEALQHPAYILDQKAGIKYANRSANTTFGVMGSGEWLFGKFRQPDLRRKIEEGLKTVSHMRSDYNEPVPNDRWFSVEMAPIPGLKADAKDSHKLFLLSFHDLTEVKRTDKMRSDFIANASHELRTPLASLLGYIETIKGPARKDDKALDRFTDIMLDQAQRMTRLVNDLLSLSRIEMKSHVRPSGSVNLTEIVSSVVVSLEEMAKQLGVKIEYEKPEAIQVAGDRDELLQVFENIIENACKYGQDGGRVIVSLAVEETGGSRQAVISVRDFGPGIAVEHQHRITERFYRVDVARSREKQGTGLGLAIVKHILNRHGTRLNVSSKPDEGAVFSVKLPLHESVENK